MKLLYCKNCKDVFNLSKRLKECSCKKTYGWYLENGLDAVYYGDDAVPLGFDNDSFINARMSQNDIGNGVVFTAFVIPKKCETFIKEGKDEYQKTE
jgi:hypothetical protein